MDSAFLQVEDGRSALHIASVGIFAGPAPSTAEIVAALERRVHLVPRLRQRLLTVPFALGRPVWADDPDFVLADHVRRVALPGPGDDAEFHEVVDQILTEHLDHDRPLWDDTVVEGLADGRWAVVTKVHHTMVDGIAGTDLLSTMLDSSAEPPVAEEPAPWSPERPPGPARLVTDAVREQARLRLAELRSVPDTVRAARHPGAVLADTVATGRGLTGFARAIAPTSASSLAGPLGRDRTYRWTSVDLATVLEDHQQLGGTINDLVLAAVTQAFRELLQARGEQPDPHAVRCLVPVSVRRAAAVGTADNEVSALLATLPVDLEEPLDRLTETSIRLRDLKASHEADAGERVTGLADAIPPPLLTAFLHLAFRAPHRNLTTVVTNVPGPSSTLFLAGRPLVATYPYVPIADRLRIGVAITSYEGKLLLGVTADRDSTPDLDVFMNGLDAGFAALHELAAQHTRTGEGHR